MKKYFQQILDGEKKHKAIATMEINIEQKISLPNTLNNSEKYKAGALAFITIYKHRCKENSFHFSHEHLDMCIHQAKMLF